MKQIIEETKNTKLQIKLKSILIPIKPFKPSQKAIKKAKKMLNMSLFDLHNSSDINCVYEILEHH